MSRQLMLLLMCLLLFAMQCASSKVRYPGAKMNKLQSREVMPADFFRLVVMRLIFGFAYLLGVGNRLDNFMGGIFVPQGMKDDDDYDDYDEGGLMDYDY